MLFGESESCCLFLEPIACGGREPAIAGEEINLRDEDTVVVVQRCAEALQDCRRVELRHHEPGRFQNPKAVSEQRHLGLKLRIVLFRFVKVVCDDEECGEDAHVYLALGVAVFVREIVADYGTERPFACPVGDGCRVAFCPGELKGANVRNSSECVIFMTRDERAHEAMRKKRIGADHWSRKVWAIGLGQQSIVASRLDEN